MSQLKGSIQYIVMQILIFMEVSMINSNYLERYIITIETLGPLYIGSGHEIGKKDWILIGEIILHI